MNPFHHILIPILMVICVALSVDVNYTGNWINGTSLLPRGNHAMAVGVYNGSIFMIGGRSTINKRAFVEYNTVSQHMIDHGTYIQQMTDTWGRGGQFYTQQMHIVYMIEFYGTMISTMDLSTNTFTSNWQTVSIMNPGVGTTGCLASTANHLYVVGGDNSNSDSGCLDTLQVFDMNAMQWISNTPSMTTIRYNVACIVHNGLLWAIGGHGGISCGQSALSSIEKINVNNIQNKQWLTTNYSLLMPVVSARAIGFGNDILVIGGCFIKAMQIIDTMSDLVTMGVNMSYPLCAGGSIIIDKRLFVFGGVGAVSSELSTWQYYNLPDTIAPTSAPSISPTLESNPPTSAPSTSPTLASNPTTASPLSSSSSASIIIILIISFMCMLKM